VQVKQTAEWGFKTFWWKCSQKGSYTVYFYG